MLFLSRRGQSPSAFTVWCSECQRQESSQRQSSRCSQVLPHQWVLSEEVRTLSCYWILEWASCLWSVHCVFTDWIFTAQEQKGVRCWFPSDCEPLCLRPAAASPLSHWASPGAVTRAGLDNTHTHTHTHTCLFFGLRGLSIGVMVFILYNLYVLLPYTYPTPKLSPHRRLCAFLNFQKNTI